MEYAARFKVLVNSSIPKKESAKNATRDTLWRTEYVFSKIMLKLLM
jgi:hypothetical protein